MGPCEGESAMIHGDLQFGGRQQAQLMRTVFNSRYLQQG